MYGVLHSVKIMNANGEFLDKEGNVTTEENAATLFDTIDAKDGKIDYKIQFTHTTLSAHKPFSMAQLSGYIKSLAADLHGQYDTKMKSEIQRTAFGHIVMSMRKWIVRTTGLRLRGAEYAFKDYDDMDMYEKGFIESTNEFKEGYYVSAVRFFGGIAKSIKKDYRNPAIRANWEKMTPAQKRNIIKTAIDAAVIGILLIASQILRAIADDEPDKKAQTNYYLLAYLTRRFYSELRFYTSPS